MINKLPDDSMRFVAIKKYKDGGEATMEHFHTKEQCLEWIGKQRQPQTNAWGWYVGEF